MKYYDLMNEKHKTMYKVLICCHHFLTFVSASSGWVSVSAFASLGGVPIGVENSAVRLKMCALTARIKKHKSIIKKRKKHDNVVLLAKTKLNAMEVLISKALIDLYINRDECVSVKNILREYNEMKEEIKIANNAMEYTI